MILADTDIPTLEGQREALERRLRGIASNPDWRVLEGFEYTDMTRGLLARGELTDRLLTALEDLDEKIGARRHA